VSESSSDRGTPLDLAAARRRLEAVLSGYRRLLVAYSGGVDSTLLLRVALDALGPDRVLAVLGDSESLAEREREHAIHLAAQLGAPLRLLRTRELENPDYARNPANRCYFCKSELFDRMRDLARAEGFDAVADGSNLDDLGDFRPGRKAGAERGVQSPLVDAGFGKREVRALSRELGLPTWDKPASPCLASRIPTGQPVDAAKLAQIDRAEQVLWDCGIRGGRVRHHGDVARIELPESERAALADPVFRQRIAAGVRAAGFRFVAVDLEPYRMGRLHAGPAAEGSGRSDPPGAAAASTERHG
jgi:pyridinium-3,5-biscarboxylic acid mononucleotide sulfurtransferase